MMMTMTMFVGGMMVMVTLQPAIASYFHPAAWAVKLPTETNIPIFNHPNDSHHHYHHHHHHYRGHHQCQNNHPHHHRHHYFQLLSSTHLIRKTSSYNILHHQQCHDQIITRSRWFNCAIRGDEAV